MKNKGQKRKKEQEFREDTSFSDSGRPQRDFVSHEGKNKAVQKKAAFCYSS